MNTTNFRQTTTIRPGLLVSLSTHVKGNVSYKRTDIEEEHLTEDGAKKASWNQERTIADPAEFERAQKVASKIGSLIRGVCTKSAFHLLCPEGESAKLDAAITEAREMAEDFNRRASLTRVSFNIMTGRIAANERDAINSINAEVRDLLADMAQGVETMDVKRIREAADRAKEMGVMLADGPQARVNIAVEKARSAAREISKAAREGTEANVDRLAAVTITEMRTSFLDFDDAAPLTTSAPVQGRALDLAAAGEA